MMSYDWLVDLWGEEGWVVVGEVIVRIFGVVLNGVKVGVRRPYVPQNVHLRRKYNILKKWRSRPLYHAGAGEKDQKRAIFLFFFLLFLHF